LSNFIHASNLNSEKSNLNYFLHTCHIHSQILWGPFEEVAVLGVRMVEALNAFSRGERVLLVDEGKFGSNPSCAKFRGNG